MDHSTAQYQEVIPITNSPETMMMSPKSQQEKSTKPRPQPEQALKCPRCDSTHTKFCYYNNYSLTQPRYFCKSCRRYWTKGGTLRNVPVGGGCRKNSKQRSSSSSKRSHDQSSLIISNGSNSLSGLVPPLTYDSSTNDFPIALARLQKQSFGHMGFDHDHHYDLHSLLNDPTRTNFTDVVGNNGINIDAFGNGVFENQNNNYMNYGMFGNNGNIINMGEIENSSGSCNVGLKNEDLMSNIVTATTTVTTMKQEVFGGRETEDRILWGFPWQINGGENGGVVGNDVDLGRDQTSWINGVGSSWHGLLNSPLM